MAEEKGQSDVQMRLRRIEGQIRGVIGLRNTAIAVAATD